MAGCVSGEVSDQPITDSGHKAPCARSHVSSIQLSVVNSDSITYKGRQADNPMKVDTAPMLGIVTIS